MKHGKYSVLFKIRGGSTKKENPSSRIDLYQSWAWVWVEGRGSAGRERRRRGLSRGLQWFIVWLEMCMGGEERMAGHGVREVVKAKSWRKWSLTSGD